MPEPGPRIQEAYAHRTTRALWWRDMYNRQASKWSRVHALVGWPAAVLSAVTGVTLLAAENLATLAGVIALVVAGLTATDAFFKPQEKATQARRLNRQYAAFWYDIDRARLKDGSDEEHLERIEAIDKCFLELQKEEGAVPAKPATP